MAIKNQNVGTLIGSIYVRTSPGTQTQVPWLRISRGQAVEKWYDMEVVYYGEYYIKVAPDLDLERLNDFFGYLVAIVIITW